MINLAFFDLAPVPNFTAVIFVAIAAFLVIAGFGLLAVYLVRRAARKEENGAEKGKK